MKKRAKKAKPARGRKSPKAATKKIPGGHGRPARASAALVAFGYETGWRLREITSRCWRHVDLEAGVVRLEPGESESGKSRDVFGSPELLVILRAQRAKAAPVARGAPGRSPGVLPPRWSPGGDVLQGVGDDVRGRERGGPDLPRAPAHGPRATWCGPARRSASP